MENKIDNRQLMIYGGIGLAVFFGLQQQQSYQSTGAVPDLWGWLQTIGPAFLAIVAWLKKSGVDIVKPDLMKILQSIAVLIQVLPIGGKFEDLWNYIQANGLPDSFSIRAKWGDVEKTIVYGDAYPEQVSK